METDKWNDVFQELRDFSPSPPASVKAAIDQQLATAATQTLGRSKKWIIYLSGFLLLVTTGLGIYFFSQSTTTNSSANDLAVNALSNSNQENNTKTSNDSELYVNKHLKSSLQQNESISTVGFKNDAKHSTIYSQKSTSDNKILGKTSNKSLSVKSQSSIGHNNTKVNKSNQTNQSTNISTKNSATKNSNNKLSNKSNYTSKKLNSTQNTNVDNGSSLKLKNKKETTSSSKSLADLTAKNSALESKKESVKVEELTTENKSKEVELGKNTDKTLSKTEEKIVKTDSTDLAEKAKSMNESSTTESTKNVEDKNDLTDKDGGKPNLKNEFGVYGGSMFTSNKRTTNLPSVQLQSKAGIQVNAYYGYRLNDRLKVNAGISYQNYKEKLSQSSPGSTDSVITNYTVIYIQNPVDTTLIDTIITPIYTVQTTQAVNGSNEIQVNRFGLNTGLSFLVYENPRMKWSYNVRVGHQLYYSQQRSIQNDLSGYPSTLGKWSGAVYFDNYLSKNIGLLNVTFGVSSTYDYTKLTNWSGIVKKRLYFSPYIGFSMQF